MSVEAKTQILEYLGRQHEEMIALLADLVNIDSGSYNKRGVDAVGDRLRAHLEAVGIVCETIPNATYGDCMAARLPGAGDNRPIVLMGHRDTVFPDGTAAERPFRVEGNQAYGPGVADMKSGLVMNTFVLEALHRFGGRCPLIAFTHRMRRLPLRPRARSSRPKQRGRARCSIPSPAGRAATSSHDARALPLSNWR